MKCTTAALIMSVIALIFSTSASAKSSIAYTKSQAAGFFRFNFGTMKITALYDGVATLPASFLKVFALRKLKNWKNMHD